MFCPRCHRSYGTGDTHCGFDGEVLVAGRRIDHVPSRKTQHIGAVFGGRYAVRGFLGNGPTARVYLAEDVKTGEPVAVKLLDPPWSQDRVACGRFTAACEEMKAIDHPNIVKVLEITARSNGTPMLVTEFLFGETLKDYLKREGCMEEDIALPVLLEIAGALAAVHDGGTVHRDVKPENVFLCGEPGEPYGIKLLDVGLARLRDATVSPQGVVVGASEHMAPEQCVADTVDPRTDIFGFGVLMFRMFIGGMPHRVDNPEEALAANVVRPSRPPRSARPGLNPGVAAIIERCLQKDPDLRYQSAEAVAEDIAAVAAGQAPDAERQSLPPSEHYVPKALFSKAVAKALYKRLGVPLPSFLS